LTVQLYTTASPNPVDSKIWSGPFKSLSGVAYHFPCSSVDWYGVVSASAYWGSRYSPSSRSYGPYYSAEVPIACVA